MWFYYWPTQLVNDFLNWAAPTSASGFWCNQTISLGSSCSLVNREEKIPNDMRDAVIAARQHGKGYYTISKTINTGGEHLR